MTTIIHKGTPMSVAHLAPYTIVCPCKLDRKLSIEVYFSNHCYTCGFNAAEHEKDDILLYEGNHRARVFDMVRYSLSFRLPAIIGTLPNCKVHQTSRARNYVYSVPLDVDTERYDMFFTLRRADSASKTDLRLMVESAYQVIKPRVMPRRPSAIRFAVLAYKVFRGERVTFAPR